MTILGIETSTAVCSVGLANEFDVQAERSIVETHIHSEKLLTLIQALCDEQKIKLSQLDGVAVSIGPGSFTGLRIGLSTAKGLCFALEKPLIAVPTFLSIAKSVTLSHPKCPRIVVCIDAKQREYYIGVYEHDNGTVREVLAVRIGSLSSMLAAASTKTVIVTDSTREVKAVSGDSLLIEEVLSYCRGDVIAHMAMSIKNSGKINLWEQLEPMYLKDFVVRTQMKLEK
jgi:tRNA threonylcarbamoyladenosine biosynthesis protein TsaB